MVGLVCNYGGKGTLSQARLEGVAVPHDTPPVLEGPQESPPVYALVGQESGIRRPSDWYRVSHQDFVRHSGGGFMLCYDCTASLAIMNHLPNYDWKEWLFEPTPKGFWHKKVNRRRYMTWLGKRLGYKSLGDWYHVTDTDFAANKGKQFLKLYRGSPIKALEDCFPSYKWNEWMFARVPFGFWDRAENRRRYIRWLATQLKIKTPKDWRRVRGTDIQANCGGGLLVRYHSYLDLLRECVPELRRCELPLTRNRRGPSSRAS